MGEPRRKPSEPDAEREPASGPVEQQLTREQHAAWWAEWTRHGQDRPIADEPDDAFPDEP